VVSAQEVAEQSRAAEAEAGRAVQRVRTNVGYEEAGL
jgi:hypothetical protein